jgi:hypothetical protein
MMRSSQDSTLLFKHLLQIVSDTASHIASAVGTVVIDVNDGPGSACDAGWQNVTARVIAADPNINVLGLVDTNYLARSLADVKADVDQWYSCYPGLGGIYVDQVPSDCSASSYLSELYQYIGTACRGKAPSGRAPTVAVMGVGMQTDCFMNASDILLTFAGDYSTYVDYAPAAYTQAFNASRFAHIIIDAACDNFNPNSPHLDAMRKAKERNAGHLFVTDNTAPTPFSRLPQPYIYWDQELRWAVNIV